MRKLKALLQSGWNFQRVLFLLFGLVLVIEAIYQQQWWGALFGAYFVLMAVLRLGCAGGQCAPVRKEVTPGSVEDADYEEIN